MSTQIDVSNSDVEEFLSHYGKRGMKWGERRAQNRALNKASRAKQKEDNAAALKAIQEHLRPKYPAHQHNLTTKEGRKAARVTRALDIQRARDRISTGAAKADLKEAKRQYKKDKINVGSREARKTLKGKKAELHKDFIKSQQAKDGFEMTHRILSALAEPSSTKSA